MAKEETLFDQFWEASSLDRFNEQQFSRLLGSYDSDDKQLFLEYPFASKPLPLAKSKVNKIAKSRKSDRSFSGKALTSKELGVLLSSFYAHNGLEHRGYPSAGATYTTEIFCVTFNTEGYSGKILYYDAENNGVVIVADTAPSWQRASESLNMSIEGEPNVLIVFVSFAERATEKYGERGGRFALIEAGAALQQLSLQIAESPKLKGVIVGGMPDTVWKHILGLDSTDAQVVLGYLVGK